MPYYSDELIEEVRSRNDIVDVISGYVRLKRSGATYFGLCPFHSERTPSFSVTPSKQMFYCYGCHKGGSVFTFLMEYESFTYPEAIEALAERAGVELPKQEMSAAQRERADRRSKLLEIQKEAARYFYMLLRAPQGERAMRYFTERQLTPETMQRFGLGYSDKYSDDLYRHLKSKGYSDALLKDSGLVSIDERRGGYDKFWNRAMFPIMDVNNHVIGFGGRVMGEGEPKYLNSPETEIFNKSRNLYGLNFARSSRRKQLLLCEGYMDVISLHQAGFDNAVASLGTSFTPGHAELLKRYSKEVYLTFDSDGAGVNAALRTIPILKEKGLTAKVINLKPYKDPDEFIKALGAEEYQKRIDEAENSFLFEIRMLERDYDLSDPESKSAFFKGVAERILEFPEELERENYIEAVASRYHTGFEQLRSLVRSVGTRGGITRERAVTQSSRNARLPKREDSMLRSQQLFLTWLIEEPRLFELTKEYIGPEDFHGDPYREVAALLYEQNEKGTLNPAAIVSHFAENEAQQQVAELFHARLHPMESGQDREKALSETVCRIKQSSLDYRRAHANPTDLKEIQLLVSEKQKLNQLRRTGIRFPG